MKTTWLMASAAMIVASAVTMAAGGPAWGPKSGKQKATPPAEAFAAAVPITTGVVKQFVINPYGEVDGFVLEDSTLAESPPHMSGELTAAVRQGDTVSVRGLRENP
jgi:hypothetical protein